MLAHWLEPVVLFGVGGLCLGLERAVLGPNPAHRRADAVADAKAFGRAIVSSAVVAAAWNALWPAPVLGFRSWRVVLAVVLFDGLLYALHRACHGVLWPMHRPHHAPKHFGASMAFRDSWAHLVLYALLLRGVGAALSLSATEFAVLSSVFIASQWWTHVRLPVRLGVLDYVVIGPAHHEVHHRHEKKQWATNLGGLLCLWDQLFGTYQHPVERSRRDSNARPLASEKSRERVHSQPLVSNRLVSFRRVRREVARGSARIR